MTTLQAALAALAVLVALFAPWPSYAASETTLMAKTAYFEARGDGFRAMLAVCFVIQNRLDHPQAAYGRTVRQVVNSPAQFSVWSPGDRQRARQKVLSPKDPLWVQAQRAARLVMAGRVKDSTRGATHFYERSIRKPEWARHMRVVALIGSHIFLRE